MDYKRLINFQTDDIIKSEEDKRLYQGIELSNGLKILLISDPDTDKSAVSLDVHAGTMHEPHEIPGLAHFCEHMLFMGTEKYPIENEYMKFVNDHAGSTNAFTAEDHTNYHFDIDPLHLKDAIDRFANFFIAPLFVADAVDREANAVDSEFLCTLPEDGVRLNELQKYFSKPDHDYRKFGCGNRKTLLEDTKSKGMDIREELLKFYNEFYSSNIMCLCVLGKETLDELTALTVPLFSSVPNKKAKIKEWTEHPYGIDQFGRQLNIVPIKDNRSLCMQFPIPDLHHLYKSKPDHYIESLLGHEGPGSLLSELKKLSWAISLYSIAYQPARGFGLFGHQIELTEEGLNHVDDIIVLTFQYFEMLKSVGPQEWYHKELDELGRLSFRFKSKEDPVPYVTSLSGKLHQYPFGDILAGPYVMPEYKPDVINDLLNSFTVNNFITIVSTKLYQGKTNMQAPWYNTEYSISHIPIDVIQTSIKSPSNDTALKFPAKNEFIPRNFDLYSTDPSCEKFPHILSNKLASQIWHKQDDEFLLPKCYVSLFFRNPLVSFDPLHVSLTNLYVKMMTDYLTEMTYNASLAGLWYNLENDTNGLRLTVSGYNEKQTPFANFLIQNLIKFTPASQKFVVLKEQLLRQLRDEEKDQPYSISLYYLDVILTQHKWTTKENIRATTNMSEAQLIEFVPRFFSTTHVTAYVHGNTTKETTTKLCDSVQETINTATNFQPLFSSQFYMDREIQLENGRSYLFEIPNDIHDNSAACIFYQIDVQNSRENILTELFVQITEEAFFDQLRTKQQLGYAVSTFPRKSNGVNGIIFIVQGEKSARLFEIRIESFVRDVETMLEKMSDDEFEKHKKSLETKRLEKPKQLESLAWKYFSEINCQQYHFDRDNMEVKILSNVSKTDVTEFYKKYIIFGGPCRKKFSIYVNSTKRKSDRTEENEEDSFVLKNVTKVENIYAFKSHLPLYSFPKPYLDVPVVGTYEV